MDTCLIAQYVHTGWKLGSIFVQIWCFSWNSNLWCRGESPTCYLTTANSSSNLYEILGKYLEYYKHKFFIFWDTGNLNMWIHIEYLWTSFRKTLNNCSSEFDGILEANLQKSTVLNLELLNNIYQITVWLIENI